MNQQDDSEEDKDVYDQNSYQPQFTTFPKYHAHQEKFFQPIETTLLFQHEDHTSNNIHYYATHVPGQEKPAIFFCVHGAGQSALVYGQMSKHFKSEGTIVAYDLMGHGSSRNNVAQEQMSIEALVKEAASFWRECKDIFKKSQKWILIGHSLGGCIVTHLAHLEHIEADAIVLIDTIEGTALKHQKQMTEFLQLRPQSFQSIFSAIRWNYKAGCVKRKESARSSVPSFIQSAEKHKDKHQNEGARFYWKVDLLKTIRHWDNWFSGVSNKFIALPLKSKILLTTSKFKLDEQLKEALEEQKFQLFLFEHSGHNIQEDEYEKVCKILQDHYI